MRPDLVSVPARSVTGDCQTGRGAIYPGRRYQRGVESGMSPGPRADDLGNRGSGTSLDPVLVMPGGDHGSGRAAAIVGAATEGAIVPFPRARSRVPAEAQLG